MTKKDHSCALWEQYVAVVLEVFSTLSLKVVISLSSNILRIILLFDFQFYATYLIRLCLGVIFFIVSYACGSWNLGSVSL